MLNALFCHGKRMREKVTLPDSTELSALECSSWKVIKHYNIKTHMEESDFTEFFIVANHLIDHYLRWYNWNKLVNFNGRCAHSKK